MFEEVVVFEVIVVVVVIRNEVFYFRNVIWCWGCVGKVRELFGVIVEVEYVVEVLSIGLVVVWWSEVVGVGFIEVVVILVNRCWVEICVVYRVIWVWGKGWVE